MFEKLSTLIKQSEGMYSEIFGAPEYNGIEFEKNESNIFSEMYPFVDFVFSIEN
tara:strand:+ start:302 stop:463 length:162 start_codon:yes stop_codon:yes gene_type:complete